MSISLSSSLLLSKLILSSLNLTLIGRPQGIAPTIHGLAKPIRGIVGAILAVALALGLAATCLTLVHAAWIFTAPHAPGAGPRRNLLYVGTNRLPEKGPLVK